MQKISKRIIILQIKKKNLIYFSSNNLTNNKSNFNLNIDRVINYEENKNFQDLVFKNKFDLTCESLTLTSLTLDSEFMLESERINDFDKNYMEYDTDKEIKYK